MCTPPALDAEEQAAKSYGGLVRRAEKLPWHKDPAAEHPADECGAWLAMTGGGHRGVGRGASVMRRRGCARSRPPLLAAVVAYA
jgi:hypothetical protein